MGKCTMTITVKIEAKTQDGQDWSPLSEAHCRFLVGEAMKRTGLYYEIISIET